jgi:hypothetical protein
VVELVVGVHEWRLVQQASVLSVDDTDRVGALAARAKQRDIQKLLRRRLLSLLR